jgi:hypothetical protein
VTVGARPAPAHARMYSIRVSMVPLLARPAVDRHRRGGRRRCRPGHSRPQPHLPDELVWRTGVALSLSSPVRILTVTGTGSVRPWPQRPASGGVLFFVQLRIALQQVVSRIITSKSFHVSQNIFFIPTLKSTHIVPKISIASVKHRICFVLSSSCALRVSKA